MHYVLTMCAAFIVQMIFVPALLAAAEKYAVSAIPPSLLPADMVVRASSSSLAVQSIDNSVYTVTYAITIFSKNEQHQAVLTIPYGRYITVEELEGTLYAADGKKVKELRSNDIQDYSAVDENSLHDDSRIRRAFLSHNEFPYTVEYTYELEFDGSLQWPTWFARTQKFPVETSSFSVTISKNLSFRYWCNHSDVTPSIAERGSSVSYTWEQSHQPSMSDEEFTGSLFDITTVVKIAPSKFIMERYEGSMESWNEFGLWFYELYRDRQSLPDNAVDEVRALTDSIRTVREKIKILYEYVQSRTRYVSIQLGMGGWKPFEAAYVHQRGYGDCKALTNYMDAVLRTVGIQSYPVLINSGNDRIPMITEFPSNQFDHVILCVPNSNDTIWLECTSQSMPFGRLGSFVEDRYALLVSSNGGTVVRTPASAPEENIQMRSVDASVSYNGTVTARIALHVSGNQQLDLQGSILHSSSEERQQWFLKRLTTPNPVLISFSAVGLEDRSTEIFIAAEVRLERYSSVSASRIFFNPSLLTKTTYVPPNNNARKSPMVFRYPYVDVDSIRFTIPKNYAVENIPQPVQLHTAFGNFSCSTITADDSVITYVRRTSITMTHIPPDLYPEYRAFYLEMAKADRGQVVLKSIN
ncbi:MAG: DUF3857 domain-containing protein [Bacteroidota bacterium]